MNMLSRQIIRKKRTPLKKGHQKIKIFDYAQIATTNNVDNTTNNNNNNTMNKHNMIKN